MYYPTSRVLAVLEILQSHKRMTGTELAQRLEVNIRTLRRYITTLQDIGIPIVAERGRYGAYTLEDNFRLPPLMFTNDEALALEVGLLVVEQLSLQDKGTAVESVRAKLQHIMPVEMQHRARALNDNIQLELNLNQSIASSDLVLLLSYAIHQKIRLNVKYQARDKQQTQREFDPYGIACLSGIWYVVGWCHLRDALRSFRLDRVLHVQLTGIFFEEQLQFDILAYLEQTLVNLPRQFTFEVLLKTDMNTARNEVFTMFGALEPHSDGVLLRGSADDLDWVAQQLASFPFDFVINTPVELRHALKKHAQQLIARADVDPLSTPTDPN